MEVVDDFEAFWQHYPRRIGKAYARKAWDKAKNRPPLVEILAAIDRAKRSFQWQRNGGQFIPHPSTWLNQGRWADEHDGGAPDYSDLTEAFVKGGGQ